MLQSITAKDFMAASLVTFSPDTDVLHAIHLLIEKGISGAPVTDNLGNIVGILSEKDCLQVALNAAYTERWGGKVEEFMSKSVICVEGDTSILEVAKMFMESPYKRYPVVEDNRLIGQISRRDVLKAIEKIRTSSAAA